MNLETLDYWVSNSMNEAISSLQSGEVPVGCLFVIRETIFDRLIKSNQTYEANDFVILCKGTNEVNATKNATRHAEMICIDQVISTHENYKEIFPQLIVIVNVEPCIMCMSALISLNVKTITFTCINDRFGYNVLKCNKDTNYIEINEDIEQVQQERVRPYEEERLEAIDKKHDVTKDVKVNLDIVKKKDETIVDKQKNVDIIEGKYETTVGKKKTTPQRIDKISDGREISEDIIQRKDEHTDGREMSVDTNQSFEIDSVQNKNEIKKDANRKTKTVQYEHESFHAKKMVREDKQSVTTRCMIYNKNEANRPILRSAGVNIVPKMFRICYERKNMFVDQSSDLISVSKQLVGESRNHLCLVINYRKYEKETMNILKLFYKGENPNAPQHKVKINKK